jgi:putative flippase GtrA
MRRAARFAIVGGLGFCVDAAVLALVLRWSGADPFLARAASITVALSATWLLNRSLTFAPSSRGVVVEGARYGGVGIATSLLNYAIYSALLLIVPDLAPLAALGLASLLAMALSFLGYSRLVFDR